ncbi:MAG: SdrD B-like domain-containing protein [Ferruginibacter sp.]
MKIDCTIQWMGKRICFTLATLFFTTIQTHAQLLVTLYREHLPNVFNQAHAAPVNQALAEGDGVWDFSSTGNSTISVEQQPGSSFNAFRFYNPTTTGLGATDAYATSPVYDLKNPGCNGKYDFTFQLYTGNCATGDNGTYLAVQFSEDGGATWNTAWQMTSGQMRSNYGMNAQTMLWLAFPSNYFTAYFRYRFVTHMNANHTRAFTPYASDPSIYSYACGESMSLGDLVWLDVNQDGVRDSGEPGVAGMQVSVIRDNDLDGSNDGDFTPLTVTTDAAGHYEFTDLTPGNYKLSLLNPGISYSLLTMNRQQPNSDVDDDNNGLAQVAVGNEINGGWITLLPGSEPESDGDGSNGNLTYDFAISPSIIVPLQTLKLVATRNGAKVSLNWLTQGEINTSFFEIQRSADNACFLAVDHKPAVAGGGNNSYQYTDDISAVTGAIVYYRLKMVDKDGKFTYSVVVPLKIEREITVAVWPNPFGDVLSVGCHSEKEEKVWVTITNAAGKTARKESFPLKKGDNQFIISNLQRLPSGIYSVSVNNSSGSLHFATKMVK